MCFLKSISGSSSKPRLSTPNFDNTPQDFSKDNNSYPVKIRIQSAWEQTKQDHRNRSLGQIRKFPVDLSGRYV